MAQSNKAWYVIYIGDARRVKYLGQAFSSLRIDHTVWVPERKVLDRRGKTRKNAVNVSDVEETVKPLFPGYAFVKFHYYEGLGIGEQVRLQTGGRFLRAPGSRDPYIVSEDDISRIKKLETSKEEAQFLASKYKIDIGDQVELLYGAFKGFRGRVVGMKRSTVLVDISILNRNVTLEVDPAHCIADE